MVFQMYRSFERKPFVPDGIRPLDFSKFEPSKLSPKLSQLVPKFHGEWDESAIQHLDAFYTFIEDYEICSEDQVMKLFARTLKDNARQAYESLPTQCISSWRQFEQWFLYEFDDASHEEEMYYEQYEDQSCNMEEDPDISLLDAFFNIERYEGETSAHLFLRTMNAYHDIPSNIKPPYKEFLNKIVKLKISPKDPDVKLLFQIWDQGIEDEAKGTKVKQKHSNFSESSVEEIEEEVDHDKTSKELDYEEFGNKEEDPLSVDEISTLLDMEYQKYVKKGGQFFLPIHKEKQIDVLYETFNEQESSAISTNPYHFHEEETNEPKGSYTSQEDGILVEDVHYDLIIERDLFRYNFKEFSDTICDGLAEENDEYSPYTFLDFEDSVNMHEEEEKASKDFNVISNFLCSKTIKNPDRVFYEDEIELYTMYEQEEVLEYIDDEDIPLAGQADYDSQSDEVSTLFDETFDDPGESSFEAMPEFSMFINPLFEEQAEKQVIEDSSEFTTFSNPLYEEDFSCSQIHQHHDEDSGSDFEIDETHEVHSEGEISSSSSHEQELQQTYEDDVESAKHDEENMLENRSENFSSIISNGVLDKGEVAHEEKHLEDGADCVQDNQAGKTHSNICIIDQKYDSTHLPFSRDHREHDDFLKAKHGMDIKDCINLVEAINVACRNSSIVFRKSEVLRDENCVFDRGKKYRSHFGGPGATQFHVHHAKHECTVCSSRDSWNLAMLTGSIRPQ